jgi:outer membrane protease
MFFAVLPPLAGETTYTLSTAPVFGFLYGHSRELVYMEPGSDTLLSELIWDIKPLFLWGASLDFSRRYPLEKTGFFADVSARFSVPYRTGYMEDRDWLASGNRLSAYSIHDNYTQWAMLFDLHTGVSLPIKSAGVFKLYAGFHYMRFDWVGRDGYTQYGTGLYTPWNKDDTKKPEVGPIISYVQNWFILAPGVSFYIPLHRFFTVNLDLQISPLVFCLDQDDHLLTQYRFNDYTFWGVFIEPRGEFIFSPHKRIDISLSAAYRFIRDPRGYTIQTNLNTGEETNHPDSAGVAFSALAAGISVKIRF